MKKILLLALLCLTVLGLGSCGRKDGVYFFNFKPEIAEKYEEIARVYEEETGVPVRVVTAASGTYEQTLKSETESAVRNRTETSCVEVPLETLAAHAGLLDTCLKLLE